MTEPQNTAQVQSNKNQKKHFTPKEDKKLKQLVKKYGENNWEIIARKIQGKTTRQCRERWMNFLSPNMNSVPWSKQENKLLIAKVNEFGPNWKQIAKFFENRTAVNLKNHYYKLKRMKEKLVKQFGIITQKVKNSIGTQTEDLSETQKETQEKLEGVLNDFNEHLKTGPNLNSNNEQTSGIDWFNLDKSLNYNKDDNFDEFYEYSDSDHSSGINY